MSNFIFREPGAINTVQYIRHKKYCSLFSFGERIPANVPGVVFTSAEIRQHHGQLDIPMIELAACRCMFVILCRELKATADMPKPGSSFQNDHRGKIK